MPFRLRHYFRFRRFYFHFAVFFQLIFLRRCAIISITTSAFAISHCHFHLPLVFASDYFDFLSSILAFAADFAAITLADIRRYLRFRHFAAAAIDG
jgi:hypothetical protein